MRDNPGITWIDNRLSVDKTKINFFMTDIIWGICQLVTGDTTPCQTKEKGAVIRPLYVSFAEYPHTSLTRYL